MFLLLRENSTSLSSFSLQCQQGQPCQMNEKVNYKEINTMEFVHRNKLLRVYLVYTLTSISDHFI